MVVRRRLKRLQQDQGLDAGIVKSVLREGFSTTETRLFIHEFRHKLDRLSRVHRPVRGLRTHRAKRCRSFCNCRVWTASCRWRATALHPDEVVAEILKQLQISDGVTDLNGSEPSPCDGPDGKLGRSTLCRTLRLAILKRLLHHFRHLSGLRTVPVLKSIHWSSIRRPRSSWSSNRPAVTSSLS
mgnify:CR=1 FL=1